MIGQLFFLEAAEAATRIRIMTFKAHWLVYTEDETDKNPWGSEYTLNEHYERIAGIIESLDPDIVNLVKVTSESGVDYLVDILHEKRLNNYKGYHIDCEDQPDRMSHLSQNKANMCAGRVSPNLLFEKK